MIGQFIIRILIAAAVFSTVMLRPAQTETLLIMGEQRGCIYCARWNTEVGPEYDKTAEGKAAPLVRIDIHKPMPDGMNFVSPLRISPTFVLLQDGVEVSRLEGYPGEDFFWGLLQRMLKDAGIDYDVAG
ncbi:hypothetical protein [Pseudoruegeria sp. HB172150]|uniref:hypothetical protein n=1 Tax=Pseudoruegeria sp. HB172150 TaxID=2721164 RepID=UPI0020A6A8FD|nr:hypothetical protein [Pseudoruegeria sp. HB172150]